MDPVPSSCAGTYCRPVLIVQATVCTGKGNSNYPMSKGMFSQLNFQYTIPKKK